MVVGLDPGRARLRTHAGVAAAGARVALLVMLALAGAACSGDDSGDGATATTVQAAVTTTGVGPTSPSTKVAGPARTKDNTFTIPSDLLFGFDSAELTPEADQLLASALELAKRLPKATISVDGYTDSIGNAGYNLELSRRRAVSVSTWLEAHGVDAGRLSVRGFGADDPVADNGTPEGRQQNRRVEIAVLSKS